MKKDQYPANIADATDILKNHKHDDAESRKKIKSPKDEQDRDLKPKPEEEIPSNNSEAASSFAQKSLKEGYCYCCGKKGHLSTDCPDKDTCNWLIRIFVLSLMTGCPAGGEIYVQQRLVR